MRAFHSYGLYGISIRSELRLPFPEQSRQQAPDVTLTMASREWFAGFTDSHFGEVPNNGRYDHARTVDGADFLRWPNFFEFVVSADGRSVACGVLEQGTTEWFQTYLLGHVLSFALVKLGYEPLHATTVVIGGRGLAFLGRSGYGKSTLAAAFVHAGHRLLTDDLLLIREVGGELCGFPGPPRIKLFADSASRFGPARNPGASQTPGADKLIVPLADDCTSEGPVPIRGFVALAPSVQDTEAVDVVLLSGLAAWYELVRGTFNARLLDTDRLKRQFRAAQEWTARIPIWRLSYPHNLAVIDEVQAKLNDTLSRCDS